MTDRLALPRGYRDQLEALLSEYVPGVEVWAYGSRVSGENHDGSDLDLVLRGPALEPLDGGLYDLLEAIEKSNIPILIQAHDWAMLPESFHREIERDYVVVQEEVGKQTTSGEWREVTLAEAPIAIIDGDRGNNYPKQQEFLESGHCLFLNAGNVTSNGFNFSSCAFVSSDRDQRLRKGKLHRDDVVLTTRGTLGNSAYFDATIPYEHVRINSGMVILRALQPALHPRYLYVLTQSQLFLSQVQALRTGSAQPQLPIRDIERITVPLPPLPEQRSIAHVLGTLDDKIELNRRMNETLEAMARALFKSWFVDFDPVRAKMDGRWRRGESLPGLPAEHYDLFPDLLVDSELGGLPKGWRVKGLSSFGKIVTGKTPSTRNSTFYGTDVPFLRIPDMHGRMYAVTTGSMLSNNGATSQSRQALPSGSVSVSCIATPGLVILNHRKTHTNQQINSIVPNDIRASKYLYWSCRQMASEIMTGGSGGSVFHNMNKSTFSALGILDADMQAIGAFENQVSSLHKMILANEKQSQNLTALREGLLPKLVSGEVRAGRVV